MGFIRTGAALLLLMPFVCATAAEFTFPTTGATTSGRVTLLAIDDQSLIRRENLRCVVSKPAVRQEPVLTPSHGNPDAPDSMAAHFYGTVLHDKGKFRMWYYPVSLRAAPEDLRQGPVCYAESDDGLHWTKPNLGQVEFNGKRDNNAILLPDPVTQCAMVIIDDSDTDPNRRYKMLYTAMSNTWTFRPATSPDGLHWTASEEFPSRRFMESGSLLRFGNRYIVHGQGGGEDQDGKAEGRQGYASTSTDFLHWDQRFVDSFRLPEPEDLSQRGLLGDYPQVHLGVGAASFGNVAVGLYGLWHNPPVDKVRRSGWYGAGLITCDLGLLVSNDGVRFREVEPGLAFISGQDSPVTPGSVAGDPTILCQANGILNVGDETLIYHGRWRNATVTETDYYAEIALGTLPLDRWGGLELENETHDGIVWTAPFTLPQGGCSISLNATDANLITADIADESGNPLPGFRSTASTPTGLECKLDWAQADLSSLGGRTVRLQFRLAAKGHRSPKLYAVYLEPAAHS